MFWRHFHVKEIIQLPANFDSSEFNFIWFGSSLVETEVGVVNDIWRNIWKS